MDILPVSEKMTIRNLKQHEHNHHQHQQNPQQLQITHGEELNTNGGNFYRTASVSFHSEIIMLDMNTGEVSDFNQRIIHKDEFGTQRVYKKTSPNCVITLYLPTREIMLSGNSPSILRGIVFVDPKAVQGYRVYAQLTLTFRYGREDEEVMGLRFCNEAIMSLHQVWPRNEEPARESLSPLQEALVKRLGEGAHPFTLSLTSQAPPSVQLVPAKRYYGAPIGTSYDVRCFIADKTDEKFHRRASVKMGVRVIYRTDVYHHHSNGPENFAALVNQTSSPPMTAALTTPPPTTTIGRQITPAAANSSTESCGGGAGDDYTTFVNDPTAAAGTTSTSLTPTATMSNIKPRKSERGDSFPKLRLSPKSFRFSGRFGRSKSEIEKCPNDPFYNYSKSFQEYDSSSCGPQGAVDKPFLLQDGRVGLRASLDKAWYTHGEDVCVTVNIRNDSRKTVRKIRVCAIQHVDVCMFNNGKFKNVVADSDTNSTIDRTVTPGGTLNTTIVLKPQRGPTKNWIALEDTLQRSTEPDEITGAIAASAIRSPNLILPTGQTQNSNSSPAVGIPQPPHVGGTGGGGAGVGGSADDRNVFAIYVSYYVKVKLTLSGMGGELSLKLPFVLVHVDEESKHEAAAKVSGGAGVGCDGAGIGRIGDIKMEKLALDDVPASKKNGQKSRPTTIPSPTFASKVEEEHEFQTTHSLDRIESMDDHGVNIHVPMPSATATLTTSGGSYKRRLTRSETLAKDLDEETEEQINQHEINEDAIKWLPANLNNTKGNKSSVEYHQTSSTMSNSIEMEHMHIVQVHNARPFVSCGKDKGSGSDMEVNSERIMVVSAQVHSHKTATTTDQIEEMSNQNNDDEGSVHQHNVADGDNVNNNNNNNV